MSQKAQGEETRSVAPKTKASILIVCSIFTAAASKQATFFTKDTDCTADLLATLLVLRLGYEHSHFNSTLMLIDFETLKGN